jgi:hypothetical protein
MRDWPKIIIPTYHQGPSFRNCRINCATNEPAKSGASRATQFIPNMPCATSPSRSESPNGQTKLVHTLPEPLKWSGAIHLHPPPWPRRNEKSMSVADVP